MTVKIEPVELKSPRKGDDDAGQQVSVQDLENGVYDVTVKFDRAGLYDVLFSINAIECKKLQLTVEKPPSAGSKWQAQFEAENEERKKRREEERLAEIEQAKASYLEHAENSKKAALEKERKQLEEEQRQREIAEHQERMRTEEGDEFKAAIVEKVCCALISLAEAII